MRVKNIIPLYGLITIFLSVVFGNTPAYSELCNNQNPSMCLEALDKNSIVIDEVSNFPNTNSVVLNFKEIPYGKAVIDQLQLHNIGSTDVITISSNSALSFPWAYFDIKSTDYVVTGGTDYIWSIYSSSGLVVKSGERKSFDIAFAPIPEGYGLSETDPGKFLGMQSHLFQQWNPFDVRISSMSFEVALNGYARGSIGKKFSVDTTTTSRGSKISVTPDMTNVELAVNEYILVYFEILQKDGNPYKEVVVLHEDETAILSKALISGQVDNSGITASYSHRKFTNGNVLLRSRDTKNETKTKYWLFFKSAEPINLQCYKKTISATGSGYDTSGAAEADLKFIYADLEGEKVEELKGVYATDDNTIPNTNYPPTAPTYIAPLNNTTISGTSINFSWNPSSDPDGDMIYYDLYLGGSRIAKEINQTSYTYIPSSTLPSGTYSWRVVAKDLRGSSTDVVTWYFNLSSDTPVETAPVEFYNSNGINISQSGITLRKGETAIVTIKIDPPSSGFISFTPVISTPDAINITQSSLTFYQNASIGGFTLTAANDIITPVSISLETSNSDYLKSDGTPYSLKITGNNPPTITSNGGGDTANISVKENSIAVTTVMASSSSSSTLLYSITGGVDKDKFHIYNDGFLRFILPPTYDNPIDSNKDNVYNVKVTVTDSNNATDSQEIAVTVIKDGSSNNVSPVLPIQPLYPADRSVIAQLTTTLSWIPAIDDDEDTLTYTVKYGKSEDKIDTTISSDSSLTSVTLNNLSDNTTYYWRVTVSDGKDVVSGATWSFTTGVQAPNSRTGFIQIFSNSELITPTISNPVGQPLAVANLVENELKLSCSYPAYSSPVDIYIMMVYENKNGQNITFFITKPNNSIGIEFTNDFKPFVSNSNTAQSGTLFSIPLDSLRKLGLTGNYLFFSGVVPAGDTTFNNYDITWFSINVSES